MFCRCTYFGTNYYPFSTPCLCGTPHLAALNASKNSSQPTLIFVSASLIASTCSVTPGSRYPLPPSSMKCRNADALELEIGNFWLADHASLVLSIVDDQVGCKYCGKRGGGGGGTGGGGVGG